MCFTTLSGHEIICVEPHWSVKMTYSDFRGYLTELEEKGLLHRVSQEVDPRFEMAAGIYKTAAKSGPALLFDRVNGFPEWRVAGAVFATQKLLAHALKVDESKLLDSYLKPPQQAIEPISVPTGPVKEIILTGEEADLTGIPFLTYCEGDESAYHHAGVTIAKNTATGLEKASIKRMEVLGKDTMALYTSSFSHFGRMMFEAEEQGKGLEVAIVVAPHPDLFLATQMPISNTMGAIQLAGALRGAPLELTRCESIDVQVPADAEMIIEGVLEVGKRSYQGLWGTERGNYVLLEEQYSRNLEGDVLLEGYFFRVTAITRRKDPIYLAMTTGFSPSEDKCLGKWATTAAVYNCVESQLPNSRDIKAINVTYGEQVVISIRKRDEATVQRIIRAVLTISIITRVIVVDEDIDIYDSSQLDWATVTRVTASKDIIVIPSPNNLPTLDKWGIDATAPLSGMPFSKANWIYKKALPPGIDKVDYI
jgi:2,5-furandicarboxylate decarboxylase 1